MTEKQLVRSAKRAVIAGLVSLVTASGAFFWCVRCVLRFWRLLASCHATWLLAPVQPMCCVSLLFSVCSACFFLDPASVRCLHVAGAVLMAYCALPCLAVCRTFVFYPVVLMHITGTVCFALTFTCSDWFNRLIGTPEP